jgi:molybdopterin-guanine dinucleotide biosynthesis protein A
MKVTAIVLAGGKSRRLGRSKALEPVDGKNIIDRVVERLKLQASEILIVTSREQFDLTAACKAEILVDLYPDKGPLGGIYTGLLAARSPRSLVVACDMPFLNTNLLSFMVELSHDFDAVVPKLGEGRLEPLHATYSKNCLRHIKSQLEGGKLEAYSFLDAVRVRYVEQAECQRFDPQLLSFFNINYQSDLDQALLLATKDDYGLRAAPDAAGVLRAGRLSRQTVGG